MENDNIIIVEMLEKLINKPEDIPPEEFMRYFIEYCMNNMDKQEELQESNEQTLELLPQFFEGKIPLNEFLLLINSTLREAILYTYKKLLDENKKKISAKK